MTLLRSVVYFFTDVRAQSSLSFDSLRPTRIGSGMMTSCALTRTPPCLMIASMERTKCWLVPMRPVTPFMMMPILCSFIKSDRSAHSGAGPVGLDDLAQELVLVHRPVARGENLDFGEAAEAGLLDPAADFRDVDDAFAHQAAIVEHVRRLVFPVADVEGEKFAFAAATRDLGLEPVVPPEMENVD